MNVWNTKSRAALLKQGEPKLCDGNDLGTYFSLMSVDPKFGYKKTKQKIESLTGESEIHRSGQYWIPGNWTVPRCPE